MLLNLMERIRVALLRQVVIGEQFTLDLEAGLEVLGRFGNARHHEESVFEGDLLNFHAHDGCKFVARDLHFRVGRLRVEPLRGGEAVSLGEAQDDHPAV